MVKSTEIEQYFYPSAHRDISLQVFLDYIRFKKGLGFLCKEEDVEVGNPN